MKVNFKNTSKEELNKFSESKCLLLISVGQESHENERFAETIKLVNHSFKSCIVSLYDSIQRITIALNSTHEPEHFHSHANIEGDLWLERNKPYYSRLEHLEKIVRWDDWLYHPNYKQQRNQLIKVIDSDPEFKQIFENTVTSYLERYCKRVDNLSHFDYPRARNLCFDYLVEECTILCLWTELQCPYEIYPNYHNEAIEATRKRFIQPFFPNCLQAVRLGFRNTKQLKPQKFCFVNNEDVII